MSPTNNSTNVDPLDVKRISVNIFTVVTLVGFFIWMTMTTYREKQEFLSEIRTERQQTVLSLKTDFHEEIDRIRSEMDNIKRDDSQHHQSIDRVDRKLSDIKIVIEKILESHEYLVENVWTKGDLALWCYEVSRKNKEFVCPDYETLKRLGLFGNVEQQHLREGGSKKLHKLQEKLDELDKDLKDNNQEVN